MKTIFGTTEKSNFILNMKESTLHSITEKLLFWGAVLVFLSQAAALFVAPAAYVPAISLTVLGFAAVLVYIVYAMKQQVTIKNPVLISIILLALFTIIAHVGARNPEVSLYGNTGRFEGVMALLSYMGIFLLASNLHNEMFLKKLLNLFLGFAVVQSIVGILQSIPALNFPSKFVNLFPEALEKVYIPSGFCGSPFSLALFLSMALAVALSAAMISASKKIRVVYAACAVLFSAVILMTHNLSGIVGICAAFIVSGIVAAVRIKKDKSSLLVWAVTALIVAAGFIALLTISGYPLYDRAIAYQDSYYNLGTTGVYAVAEEQENLYTEFWGKTADIISMFPAFGTGPDCLYVPQQHGEAIMSVLNSFDRCYNDFLYVAATRGIPALAAYIAFLVTMIVSAVKKIKSAEKNSYTAVAALCAVLAYIAASFVNFSTITVTPFFFLLAGIAAYNAKPSKANK